MSKEEQLKLEYNALIEEFKTIRENILFDVGASRQVINLTLTAAGILIAGTPYIIQSQLLSLFLIAPVIFYAFAWAQIRYLFLDDTLSDYVVEVLAPRLRQTLAEISPNDKKDFETILSWETFLRDVDRRSILILLPIAGGNYGVNLLVAALSIVTYFIFVNQKNLQVTTLDIVLIVLNVLLFSYTAFLGFWARFNFARKMSKSA